MCYFSKPEHFDEEEAIARFKASPSKYFTYRRNPVEWPSTDGDGRPIFLSNVRVLVGEHTLGFVERAHCTGNTTFIGHIAVSKALSGRGLGLGPLIVRAYAAELRARYGISRIVFAEDHTDYEAAGYQSFFARLGAKPLPVNPRIQRADRPDFEWLERDWGI